MDTTNVNNEALGNEKISLAKVDDLRQNSMQPVKEKFELEIRNSGVIDTLTSQIDIHNMSSIVEFGKEPAQKMATIADQVMSQYNGAVVDNTSKMINALLGVMKKIDIEEIKSLDELSNQKKGFFSKFKTSAKDKLDKLINKYKGIGHEIETICNELSKYEIELRQTNENIAKMYESAKVEYKELVEVVMSAEQAVNEIEEYCKQKEEEALTNDEAKFEAQNARQALQLMQQRHADLQSAESLALMSVPTFKIQEYTNANIARKVNSAFIVTVPAFKTAMVNALISKQQQLQMQGLAALDEATNKVIEMNAQNTVNQLKTSQQMANTSAIKAETLEKSWNTIMDGIKQYKEMEEQYAKVREAESQRIKELNDNYLKTMGK